MRVLQFGWLSNTQMHFFVEWGTKISICPLAKILQKNTTMVVKVMLSTSNGVFLMKSALMKGQKHLGK